MFDRGIPFYKIQQNLVDFLKKCLIENNLQNRENLMDIFTGEKLVETVTNATRYGVSSMAETNVSVLCSGTLTVIFQIEEQVQ